jgi:hypothetical protein
MADLTVKRTDEFEPTFRGGMLKARAGLGTGEEGAIVLALGGIPGRPFEPRSFTNEGEADPLDG